VSGYLRSLFPRLSPALWLLQVGYFVKAVGTGMALCLGFSFRSAPA
jgi:hypothetical protein